MMINKRLIGTVRESKKFIAGNVAFQWLSLAANITMMVSITGLLADLYAKTADTEKLRSVLFVAAAALLIRFVCTLLSNRMSYLSSKTVKSVLRERIYQKLLRLGASYKEQVKTSEVVQVAVEGVDQLETYFGAYLPQFFYAMLAPLTLFVVLCFVNVPCAVNSGSNRYGTALGKKAFGKVLGAVYGAGRYVFGKSAGLNHPENISGR